MVALCQGHHTQADGGGFTKAQLREMKRNPYVDDAIRVAWPYQTETLVIKVGRSLVVGSGSAIRLDGRPAISVRPHRIENVEIRTVIFDADIIDECGERWIRIEDGWADIQLAGISDLQFSPQAKRFVARRNKSAFISLTYSRRPFAEYRNWISTFMDKKDLAESAAQSTRRVGAIDSDGLVPVMELEGAFQTKNLKLDVRGDRMKFTSLIPGLEETFEWHSWVVDEKHRAILTRDKECEFFSLG